MNKIAIILITDHEDPGSDDGKPWDAITFQAEAGVEEVYEEFWNQVRRLAHAAFPDGVPDLAPLDTEPLARIRQLVANLG